MTTVAVTGAAGRLGRRVLPLLEADPDVDRVVAIDLEPVAATAKVEPAVADLLVADLRSVLGGSVSVIHLAGSSQAEPDDGDARLINVDGTKRLLDAATAAGISNVVALSSAMVYGAWPTNPVPLTEDAPLRPNAEFAYAVQRARAEELLADWADEDSGRTVAVLRPTVALAEGEEGFIARALAAAAAIAADGNNPPAQFLSLDDLASAVDVARRGHLDGPYNVAPDGWISTETVRALTGSPPRVVLPTPVAARLADWSWRFRRGPIAPGLLPYTMHPWVVANDRLKAAGWTPTSTNEESYVEGTEGSWWSMLSPKRRQEVALGSAGAGLAAVGTVAALITRRVLRGR